jgi:hypothetical protein
VTAGVEDYEFALFATRFKELSNNQFNKENTPQKHCTGNFWLIKPANLNQG